MKAKFLLLAVFACMMAFTACTQEKIVYVEKEDISGENDDNALENIELKPGEGIIKISLSNGLSRAPRPLKDYEATNNVNRILFKFVNSDTGVEYNDFIVESAKYSKSNYPIDVNNKVLEFGSYDEINGPIVVKFSNLTQGSYKVFAFGYNYKSSSNLKDEIPFKLDYNKEKSAFKCTLNKEVAKEQKIEELFAGKNSPDVNVIVNKFGLFDNAVIDIELTRQVAALVAYMKNVPHKVNKRNKKEPVVVKKITISTPQQVNSIYAPSSQVSQEGLNGADFSYTIGAVEESELCNITFSQLTHLLTFNLETNENVRVEVDGKYYEFFKEESSTMHTYLLAEENDYDTFDDEFGNVDEQILKPMKDTMFGSCFLYAFGDNYSTENIGTLNICYWDEGDNLIDLVDLEAQQTNGGSTNSFLIRCNYLYKIGNIFKRNEDGKDEPMDIEMPSGIEDINVKIIDDYTEELDLINPNTSASSNM